MISIVNKNYIIESLEKKAERILNWSYDKKEDVLEDRFIEINEMLQGRNRLSEKEFSELIERGIEPVTHIYGDCFLVSYFETHTYGIANFNTKKLILPCNFSEINFDSSQKSKKGLIVYATDIFDNTTAYLIKDTAQEVVSPSMEKSIIVDKIAKRHNLTTSVDISTSEKIVI